MLLLSASLPDWLTAIGGIGAFLATGVLAFIAWKQMKKLDTQATTQAASTSEQIAAMRDQVHVLREASVAELAVIERQVAAAVEQGRQIREAARAELQPIVFAHAVPVVLGPNDEYSIDEGQVAIAYYLQNEGSGIALNIRHGVEIEGIDYEHGGGMQVRVLRPGEALPPRDAAGLPIWRVQFSVVRDRHDLPDRWEMKPRRYWTSFESVFGERFETRNPSYPDVPADFRRVQ